MDEAFMPLREVIRQMLSFRGEFVDEEMGVHSYIYEYEIESPLELDIVRDEQGQIQIGSSPPIYYVNTSIRPSFHNIRFKAELQVSKDEDTDVQ